MKSEKFFDGRVVLNIGDCRKVVAKMKEGSVDSVVCDPPYHLQSIVKRFAKTGRTDKTRSRSGPHQRTAAGFMNKKWDGGDIAFSAETWALMLRALKPGGYIAAFSSTRTFGRMSVALEDAGFITHPFIAWMFGQGFPKAHRIAASGLSDLDRETEGWDGWRYGTQSLKPAIEPVYIGQKPFEEGLNGWQNVQKWGVGALNIDGCRVASDGGEERIGEASQERRYSTNGGTNFAALPGPRGGGPNGRWPANVIHDGSHEVISRFPEEAGAGGRASGPARTGRSESVARSHALGTDAEAPFYADSGSASRFFYAAKADSDERTGSKHPTVKPIDLMQYLVRLITPPGGVVLDPFAGTGTTGEAAWRERCRAVLIEAEAEYIPDIRRRMKLALAGPDERRRETIKEKTRGLPIDMGPLFGGAE